MRNNDNINKKIKLIKTDINDINGFITEHFGSLSFPMDSWLEDRLVESVIHKIMDEENCIGYAGIIGETLHFYHVTKKYFRYAASILETIIQIKAIKRVFIMTQDSLLCA